MSPRTRPWRARLYPFLHAPISISALGALAESRSLGQEPLGCRPSSFRGSHTLPVREGEIVVFRNELGYLMVRVDDVLRTYE